RRPARGGRPSLPYRLARCGQSSTARHSLSAQRRVAPPDRGEWCHCSGRSSWRRRGSPITHRTLCRSGDGGRFFVAPAPVPAREQRNSVAVNTLLRHRGWHARWSSSYACTWCTPVTKGTLLLLEPLRGNIPLAGVHVRALLAPVIVLLHCAKSWQLAAFAVRSWCWASMGLMCRPVPPVLGSPRRDEG